MRPAPRPGRPRSPQLPPLPHEHALRFAPCPPPISLHTAYTRCCVGRVAAVRYRRLGDSDIEVSEISLGSWLTYGAGVERDQTEACTRAAFDAGINFFDTSNVYGQGTAESAWGAVLPDFDRDSYVLATKVFFQMSDDETDKGLSREQIHKQLDASLQRLRVDHVDLYQCHRPDPDTPIE